MLRLFSGFTLASSKIVATFFMVIFLLLLGLVFFPDLLNRLSDFTNWIEGQVRDPDINDQGKFLFRKLVNEDTIFGIIMTLIARAVIELIFWIAGMMWRIANPEDKEPAPAPAEMTPGDVPPTYYRN